MKIIMGCDYGGFELKETLKKVLIEKGYEVEDYGIHKQERVDYPDYAQKVGEAIASGKGDQGILICGTGIGMSIAANKVKGVRAALCNDCYSAAKARQHNNANVLAMGGRVVSWDMGCEMAEKFLAGKWCEGFAEQRRLNNEKGYAVLQEIEGGM